MSFLYKFGDPPCRYCTKRTVGCHGKCDDYKNWDKKEQEYRNEKRRQEGLPPLRRFYNH